MMTEELSDVALLTFWGLIGAGIALVWVGMAVGLALLIGRVIRGRNRQVPVEPETREMAIIRMPPTDTVEMAAVRR